MISGVQWNSKAVVAAVIAGAVILYAGYNMWHTAGSATGGAMNAQAKKEGAAAGAGASSPGSEKKFPNVLMSSVKMDVAVPKELLDEATKPLAIEEKEIKIEMAAGTPTLKVFYRETLGSADKVPVLLLHGMKFTSQNWVDIKTIHFASKMGHRVVAVDLPGYGKTGGKVADKGKFLDTLIGVLGLGRPVIVSPSMSGSFSLPFILGKFSHKPSGYIPVAPPAASSFKELDYKQCKVPVLIMYGSEDKSLGETSAVHLRQFPNSKVQVIDGAHHAAYLDKPDEWHKILYNFLLNFDKK